MPWPSIDPGRLRHRITFLAPTATQGIAGTETTYAPANPPITARAAMDVQSANDAIRGGQDVSQEIAVWTIRYQPNINPEQRFIDESGSTWIIKGVKNQEGRRRLLELVCLGLGQNT